MIFYYLSLDITPLDFHLKYSVLFTVRQVVANNNIRLIFYSNDVGVKSRF